MLAKVDFYQILLIKHFSEIFACIEMRAIGFPELF
jgi:hypothetical protein